MDLDTEKILQDVRVQLIHGSHAKKELAATTLISEFVDLRIREKREQMLSDVWPCSWGIAQIHFPGQHEKKLFKENHVHTE